MSVTQLPARTVSALASPHGPPADAGIFQPEEHPNACHANGMAQKFAAIADPRAETSPCDAVNVAVPRRAARAAGTPPPAVGTPAPAAENADKRRLLTHRIGTEVARGLGWNPGDYTELELAALGERLIADYAVHGDEASGAGMLVAIAKAAGALDAAAMAEGDHDKIAGRIAEFLHAEFNAELAVSHSAIRLSKLQVPTRLALGGELLKKLGIEPEKRAYRPDAYREPANFRGKRIQDKPAEHYINADALSAWDLRYMTRRELSDDEVAAMQAQLPASLAGEFDQRFDAYTRKAADLSTTLIDDWLNWVARKQGIDLADAHIELSTGTLQYSQHTAIWLGRGGVVQYDAPQIGFPTLGYLATIRSGGKEYRYFFSTRDGSAKPLPPGESFDDWARRSQAMVFGVAKKDASNAKPEPGLLDPPVRSTWKTHAWLQPLAQGRRDQLAQWLSPVLHERFAQGRDAARGNTSLEGMTDFLLDFVPYRSAIVALTKGDLDQAKFLIFMDTVFFLIPTLSSLSGWKKGAVNAARDLATLPRLIGDELATRGVSGIRQALADLPKLRESIKTALTTLNATSAMAEGLLPLDAQAMANSLRANFPTLADALEQSVELEHGPRIFDGEWRVPPASRAEGEDALIEALPDIQATDREGNTLELRSYNDDSGRAYTQIDPATKRATGAILLTDSEGRLYQSLPARTLEGYRVREQDVLRALGAQRPAADGTLTVEGKTYARIVDDYVEIAPEHGSTVDRPAWRVVAPRAAKRDIVPHRLFYDKERALWRGADMPELKGGSGRGLPSPFDAAREDLPRGSGLGRGLRGSAPHGNPFHEVLLSRVVGASAEREMPAVRDLLTRLQAHPRAKPILRAMEIYYEAHNKVPEIVLLDGVDAARPRPLLEQPASGNKWHMDLNALNAGSLDEAAGEVAAVYNNMTGILQGEHPFAAHLARGEPRLDKGLEKSWRQWIRYETERAQGAVRLPMGQQAMVPQRHEALIQNLRAQLREAHCYGGLDRDTFIGVLENRFDGDIPGLRVDLSEQNFALTETGVIAGMDRQIITTIPPLPDEVYALDVSDRAIRDWSNLPRDLKILGAANTGGGKVLEHLPAGLVELDVSRNGLDELAVNLAVDLKKLTADGNRLTALPRFAEGLQELSINDNRLEHLVQEHFPSSLKVLRANGNRFRELTDLSRLRLQRLELSRNEHLAALPRLSETLETLYAADCSLAELPEGLANKLEEIHVGGNRLTRLPGDLSRRLYVLDLRDNRLERLVAGIEELASCDIYLRGNPIRPENLPPLAAGRRGPRFHLT